MGGSKRDIRQRILAGEVGKKDVMRRLAELAYGRVNDCVKLAVEESPELDGLDLSLLSEVRRNEKGMVEVKLIDRLKVLEQLSKVIGEEENQMASFLQAVQGGGDG
ncbi:MAG: terminase small subunit [Oscillospiraceae bacterium]|nr:terminase small subunit [Oscillospiraceae bacterium]